MAMQAPPDIAGRPFRDLRSARKASNRERKHRTRYNNFKQLQPADLPSHPKQQTHLRPLCCNSYCKTYNTVDNCAWSTFPADLSAAPSAKFTKREAFEVVKGWRSSAPRLHHSRERKDMPKYLKSKLVKHLNTNEADTKKGEWIDDLDWYDYVDLEFYYDCWRDWDDEYYFYNICGGEVEERESPEDEGYHSDNDGKREFRGDVEWNWHRTLADGHWYATKWRCMPAWCACDQYEERERQRREEAEAAAEEELEKERFEKLEEEYVKEFREDEEDECDLCYRIKHGIVLSDTGSEAGMDWDVISNDSEAWSEIDGHGSDNAVW